MRLATVERWVGYLSIPLFLGAWQAVSMAGLVNVRLFPPPTRVAQDLWSSAISGPLFIDLAMSTSRVVIGYLAGAVCGIAVGLLTGRIRLIDRLLAPVFQMLRPIPPIAFVSIVILWVGLSESGKVFLIVWGVFFTVWLSTHLGVQKVDTGLIRAARSLGAPEARLMTAVILPCAMPTIVVGLRTAIGVSFYTLVAAELAGTFAGLAYRIDISHQNMQIGQMMGGLIMLGIISALADRAFASLAKRTVWWG